MSNPAKKQKKQKKGKETVKKKEVGIKEVGGKKRTFPHVFFSLVMRYHWWGEVWVGCWYWVLMLVLVWFEMDGCF